MTAQDYKLNNNLDYTILVNYFSQFKYDTEVEKNNKIKLTEIKKIKTIKQRKKDKKYYFS